MDLQKKWLMGSEGCMINSFVLLSSFPQVLCIFCFLKPKAYMLIVLSGCFLLFTVVYNYTETLTNIAVLWSLFLGSDICDYDLICQHLAKLWARKSYRQTMLLTSCIAWYQRRISSTRTGRSAGFFFPSVHLVSSVLDRQDELVR